jgi:hypothetical protein
VNEYRHILVPVDDSGLSGTASLYYCAGRLSDRVLVHVESDVGELFHGRFPPCVGTTGPTPADDSRYTRIGPAIS